jgi:hypothetical protein
MMQGLYTPATRLPHLMYSNPGYKGPTLPFPKIKSFTHFIPRMGFYYPFIATVVVDSKESRPFRRLLKYVVCSKFSFSYSTRKSLTLRIL